VRHAKGEKCALKTIVVLDKATLAKRIPDPARIRGEQVKSAKAKVSIVGPYYCKKPGCPFSNYTKFVMCNRHMSKHHPELALVDWVRHPDGFVPPWLTVPKTSADTNPTPIPNAVPTEPTPITAIPNPTASATIVPIPATIVPVPVLTNIPAPTAPCAPPKGAYELQRDANVAKNQVMLRSLITAKIPSRSPQKVREPPLPQPPPLAKRARSTRMSGAYRPDYADSAPARVTFAPNLVGRVEKSIDGDESAEDSAIDREDDDYSTESSSEEDDGGESTDVEDY
jgi:hypothetical protein